MSPTQRAAGIAGVLAGVGLAVEAAFWMTSGWTPETFGDPATALAFLGERGDHLRAAVFAGALNLVFTIILIAGLAERLRPAAPTWAAGTLLFGIVGVASHGLVPLALWWGIPMFVARSAADPAVQGGWIGFAVFIAAAGGLGSVFLGASTLAAGWGAVATRTLPAVLGWIGIAVGVASVLTVVTAYTPLSTVGQAVYVPSLLLAIGFRTWAGIHLLRSARQAPRATAPAAT